MKDSKTFESLIQGKESSEDSKTTCSKFQKYLEHMDFFFHECNMQYTEQQSPLCIVTKQNSTAEEKGCQHSCFEGQVTKTPYEQGSVGLGSTH